MSKLETYFPNHEKASRFPWSIYHGPQLGHLYRRLERLKDSDHVLVIGPGAFQECSSLLKKGVKVSILDIDPRILELHRGVYGEKISGYYLVDENFTGYPNPCEFDFIYAKEVIEHLVDYRLFCGKIFECLKRGGSFWVSTPNYGFFLLPLLEKSILELIARFSGFSRADIHPTKFNAAKLVLTLEEAGFEKVDVIDMPYRLSLIGEGLRP